MSNQISSLDNIWESRQALLSLYQRAGLSLSDGVSMPEKFDLANVFYSTQGTLNIDHADINAALDEWDVSPQYQDLISEQGPGDYHCCCSQNLRYAHIARNRYNGNVLLVGRCCYDKYDGHLDVDDDSFIDPDSSEEVDPDADYDPQEEKRRKRKKLRLTNSSSSDSDN
jgi:hypothetical protein